MPKICLNSIFPVKSPKQIPGVPFFPGLELEEAPEDITNSPASASSNMGYYGLLPLREIMPGPKIMRLGKLSHFSPPAR